MHVFLIDFNICFFIVHPIRWKTWDDPSHICIHFFPGYHHFVSPLSSLSSRVCFDWSGIVLSCEFNFGSGCFEWVFTRFSTTSQQNLNMWSRLDRVNLPPDQGARWPAIWNATLISESLNTIRTLGLWWAQKTLGGGGASLRSLWFFFGWLSTRSLARFTGSLAQSPFGLSFHFVRVFIRFFVRFHSFHHLSVFI